MNAIFNWYQLITRIFTNKKLCFKILFRIEREGLTGVYDGVLQNLLDKDKYQGYINNHYLRIMYLKAHRYVRVRTTFSLGEASEFQLRSKNADQYLQNACAYQRYLSK